MEYEKEQGVMKEMEEQRGAEQEMVEEKKEQRGAEQEMAGEKEAQRRLEHEKEQAQMEEQRRVEHEQPQGILAGASEKGMEIEEQEETDGEEEQGTDEGEDGVAEQCFYASFRIYLSPPANASFTTNSGINQLTEM